MKATSLLSVRRPCTAFILALGVSAAANADPIPFTTVTQGYHAGIRPFRSPETFVIRDQRHWLTTWRQLKGGVFPRPPAPVVRFSRDMVVGVLSQFPSGGYRHTIVDVEETDDAIVVKDELTRPGPHCAVTAVITQPHHFVRFARSEKPVRFDVRERVTDCR